MTMKLIRYSFLILAFLTVAGCKDFLDVNTTPNNPTSVPPALLLSSGLIGSGFANGNELNRYSSVLVNYLSGAGNSPANYDVYITTPADFGNQWLGELYEGSLTEYQRLIETSDKLGAKSYTGIAKIMKAYTFSLVTDVWGDVPYSQALQGTAFVNPRIDKQQDIYEGNSSLGIQSLFDLVKEGLADLDAASTANPGNDDVVYGGSIDSWRRAGNTLLLKLATTISVVDPARATAEINAIKNSPMISTNAQSLAVKFGAVTGSQSPIYTYNYVSSFITDLIASTRYVNRLTALNDPRLPVFISKPNGTSYVTIDNGNGRAQALPTPSTSYSRWSTTVVGVNGVGPIKLISNAHRAFMMAEAMVRLGINGLTGSITTADKFYEEGIRASFAEAGLTSGQADAYITANSFPLAGTTDQKIQAIITQKYIALTGNGVEAWTDWRRTGYPVLPENNNAQGIDNTRPVRAMYPNQELQRNPNFTQIQTNVKVWWDAN